MNNPFKLKKTFCIPWIKSVEIWFLLLVYLLDKASKLTIICLAQQFLHIFSQFRIAMRSILLPVNTYLKPFWMSAEFDDIKEGSMFLKYSLSFRDTYWNFYGGSMISRICLKIIQGKEVDGIIDARKLAMRGMRCFSPGGKKKMFWI